MKELTPLYPAGKLNMMKLDDWITAHTNPDKKPNINEYTGVKPDCLYHIRYDYEWANWNIDFFKPINL